MVTPFAFLVDVARNNIGREWEWSSNRESDKLVIFVDVQPHTPHVKLIRIVIQANDDDSSVNHKKHSPNSVDSLTSPRALPSVRECIKIHFNSLGYWFPPLLVFRIESTLTKGNSLHAKRFFIHGCPRRSQHISVFIYLKLTCLSEN